MTEDVHVLLKLGAAEGLHLLDWILQGTEQNSVSEGKKKITGKHLHVFIFLRHISITTFRHNHSISVQNYLHTLLIICPGPLSSLTKIRCPSFHSTLVGEKNSS